MPPGRVIPLRPGRRRAWSCSVACLPCFTLASAEVSQVKGVARHYLQKSAKPRFPLAAVPQLPTQGEATSGAPLFRTYIELYSEFMILGPSPH